MQSAKDALSTPAMGAKAAALRRSAGEFVGQIFYVPLLQEMQKSKFKTKYLSGGRAEEAFQGQLAMEMAKRIGRSANDPVAQRLFESIGHRLGVTGDAKGLGSSAATTVHDGGEA